MEHLNMEAFIEQIMLKRTYQNINPPSDKAGSENGAIDRLFEQDPEVSNKIYVAYDEVYSNTNLEGWIKNFTNLLLKH